MNIPKMYYAEKGEEGELEGGGKEASSSFLFSLSPLLARKEDFLRHERRDPPLLLLLLPFRPTRIHGEKYPAEMTSSMGGGGGSRNP